MKVILPAMHFDVVVIGAGMAGAAAALAAVAEGARVAVVRAGPGVTGLCNGAWHGPLPQPIATALEGAGLPHVSCEWPLPHPAGDLRACTFAPVSHAAARVDEETLVCGIAGLPGFNASALARLWMDDGAHNPMAGRTDHVHTQRELVAENAAGFPRVGTAARHATLALEDTPAAGWSSVSLAAILDRDAALLVAPLVRAVRESGARRVLLPAVLGLQNTDVTRGRLSQTIDADVGEALGTSPSLPGWRLARAMDNALLAAGAEILDGRAVHDAGAGRKPRGAARAKRRVAGVYVADDRSAGAHRKLDANCFVLATGKFAGGGITATTSFVEKTFGLPVWVEHLGRRFTTPNPLALTNVERGASQAILGAGVRADDDLRPLDENGDVVYENLFVAGSVRAGVNAAELPLGDAAQDGWRAGELAARSAR